MVMIMLILFSLFTAQRVNGIPGFTTSGTHFVFSFANIAPELGRRYAGQVQVTTENKFNTSAVLSGVTGSINRSMIKRFIVNSSSPSIYKIPWRASMATHFSFNNNVVFFIKSFFSIQVVLIEEVGLFSQFFTSIRLFPEYSCRHRYFVSTPIGHPVILVHSFDRKTKLLVRFPRYLKPFRKQCAPQTWCRSESEAKISLDAYSVWHFSVRHRNAEFHNTKVMADQPVFVVSGSTRCSLKTQSLISRGACLASSIPAETWGRQYAVPLPAHPGHATDVVLRFNAVLLPFYVVIRGDGNKSVAMVRTHTTTVHCRVDGFILVTSSVSFGLSIFLHRDPPRDPGMINAVPVEQWMSGLFYVPFSVSENKTVSSFVLATTANPKSITSTGADLKWKLAVSEDSTSYWTATLDTISGLTKIFSKKNVTKMILYVGIAANLNGFDTYASDFHLGDIDRLGCVQVKPVLSDGFDNDCDGVIDEEVENGVDDDDDGKVDEDTIEPYQDGQWSEWMFGCDLLCLSEKNGRKKLKYHIRSCNQKQPSRFGKSCAPVESYWTFKNGSRAHTCPAIDIDFSFFDGERCFCDGNCDSNGNEEDCWEQDLECNGCKPGYFLTPYCTTPCPMGWSGLNCVDGPRNYSDFETLNLTVSTNTPKIEMETVETTPFTETSFPWVFVAQPLVFVVGVAFLVWLWKTKTRRDNIASTMKNINH